MRLIRLALENWRGIDAREIRFAGGVTLIEGPNEIGKSTIVEALLTLIGERDSSKKQRVKAVMPAGRDVGSRVEAEIETGGWHFVYAKTYNKSPQTSLDILAPKKEQVTGREAHERAGQILDDTVDLALWEALLAEQGNSVVPADLAGSGSLARALDEAAGAPAAGREDMALYEAVQAEYLKYYTLKAGRPQFLRLEQDFERASAERDAARDALAEIERDADEHERIEAEVRRRQRELPELQARVRHYERSRQAVDTLRRELELKESGLATAAERKADAEKALAERRALVAAIAADEQALDEQKKRQAPLARRAEALKRKLESARLVAEDRRKRRNAARERAETAREDAACLEDLERLARDRKRLRDHAGIADRLKATAATVHDIAVDDAGLEALREAERALEIARQKRDLAATTVSVTAERAVAIEIDDEAVSLEAGAATGRTVAAGLDIRFPGVASVRVTPPQSAAELATEFSEAEAGFGKALARHRVANLKEAIERNEARRAAQQDLTRLKARADEILGEDTVEEIEQAERSLRQQTDAYLKRRGGDAGLPASLAEARDALAAAEKARQDQEAAFERAREQEAGLGTGQAEADTALREAGATRIALEATLSDKKTRLTAARAETPDEALVAKLRDATGDLERLAADVKAVRERLEALAPDTVETLCANAKDALERAERELAASDKRRVALGEVLERARADGRFEALEAAERTLEGTRRELEATRRRAAAAERLWKTLNRHRDAARQAYVRPLREAIERLGRVVFGPGFEVSIGDDWKLESRSLDGTTLPFEALSVGTREQLGILARLAAARIVAEQGGVPLIIDDALGFSDPSRLETMGAAIAAAGKECQIIILTSTPGRFTHVGNAAVVNL